ncbi:DUF3265 domain-containing protein [Vibrio parahaemolyticus]|nr:DUF3265 domain-containing protein [Vibrio parahaemolyticus]EJG1072225.1 DUF3265 domain-containing protein [Vibrio parahaemolyticus]
MSLSTYITKRSRGIHAAWHFWYAVCFVGKSGLQKAGLSGTHPLTQRYTVRRYYGLVADVTSYYFYFCCNKIG